MAGICTGPGPCDVVPFGAGKNWVNKVGGLPLYIRAIAHALHRSGHSESDAIQLAVGTVQRWARGGGNVTAGTRTRAAAALAEWERKRAEAHLSNDGGTMTIIDLVGPKGYEHGWVKVGPGDPKTAKALRAKANAHRRAADKATTAAERDNHNDRARDYDVAASLVEGKSSTTTHLAPDVLGTRSAAAAQKPSDAGYSDPRPATRCSTSRRVSRLDKTLPSLPRRTRRCTASPFSASSDDAQAHRKKAGTMNFSRRPRVNHRPRRRHAGYRASAARRGQRAEGLRRTSPRCPSPCSRG